MEKFIKKNKRIIGLLLILGLFSISGIVFAVDWPDSPAGTSLDPSKSDITTLIKYLYEWGISLGGLAVFIVLLIAGFQYLTSAGDPTKMSEAKERITSAISGLVLLLSSWLILNTINPELTSFKPLDFNPKDIPTEDLEKLQEYTGIPCSFAVLYSETDFGGKEKIINPDTQMAHGSWLTTDVERLWKEYWTSWTPKSIKAYYDDQEECSQFATSSTCRTNPVCVWMGDHCVGICSTLVDEGACEKFPTWHCGWNKNKNRCYRECAEEGACGGVLYLYAGSLTGECGDTISAIPAYEKNINRWIDRGLKCTELISPPR